MFFYKDDEESKKIENDPRYTASEKTNIVTMGKWTYYQNTHFSGTPAWCCYFGKEYLCSIYEVNGSYRVIVKKGDWLSVNAKIVSNCCCGTLETAQNYCKQYML